MIDYCSRGVIIHSKITDATCARPSWVYTIGFSVHVKKSMYRIVLYRTFISVWVVTKSRGQRSRKAITNGELRKMNSKSGWNSKTSVVFWRSYAYLQAMGVESLEHQIRPSRDLHERGTRQSSNWDWNPQSTPIHTLLSENWKCRY